MTKGKIKRENYDAKSNNRFMDEFGNKVDKETAEILSFIREESKEENQTISNLMKEMWKISEDFLPKIFQCDKLKNTWLYQLKVQYKKQTKEFKLKYSQKPSLKKLAQDIAKEFGVFRH